MNSHNQEVKVVEVCKVDPPPSTTTITTTHSSLQLTHFGYACLRLSPTQRLFFYKTSDEATTILPKLKHSLSVTLQHYLPIAGKVTWPSEHDKPIIRYVEGDGVSLTVAEAPRADFHRFTDDNNIVLQVEEFCPFLPELSSTHVEAAAMALQVTFFGGEGYSIGYSAHHAVVDGKSMSMFMHAWATTCRNIVDNKLITEPDSNTPSYGITDMIRDKSVQTRYLLNSWLDHDRPNNKSVLLQKPPPLPLDLVQKTFSLTPEVIEHIKRLIHTQWQGESPSTFTAIVSYIWVYLVKSKHMLVTEEVDQNEKFHFGFLADARARLQPPLPSTYFGNCDVNHVLSLSFHELVKEDGVATAAKAIAEAIEGLKNGVVFPGPETWKTELLLSSKGLLTNLAGSHKFQAYNIDFGWGNPTKVEITSMNHSGNFALVDSRDGNGGLEVGIVLRKHEMEIFSHLFVGGLGTH